MESAVLVAYRGHFSVSIPTLISFQALPETHTDTRAMSYTVTRRPVELQRQRSGL